MEQDPDGMERDDSNANTPRGGGGPGDTENSLAAASYKEVAPLRGKLLDDGRIMHEVKMELQLYRTREGEYIIDAQLCHGQYLLFFDICHKLLQQLATSA